MGDILIEAMSNAHHKFYNTIGPFLSRREIVKELGCNVWDDDDKVWYVATKDGEVCGFVAAKRQGNNILFCSDYVRPKYRGQGIYSVLFATRLYDYKNESVIATVTSKALDIYLANGFIETGKRGKYYMVKRDPK